MKFNQHIELLPRNNEPAPAARQRPIENPHQLVEGRRVQVEWIAERLVQLLVTRAVTGQSGEGFSFTQPTYRRQEALHSVAGTITKAMPDGLPGRLTAQTVHITPDPVFRTTEDGELYKQTQPPRVIPLDSFADYRVTAF